MPAALHTRSQILALTSILSATISSVLLKLVTLTPAAEAIALRSIFAFLILAVVLLLWPAPDAAPIGWSGAIRSSLDALAALTLSLAIFLLPLSLLASIHATLPILSVLLSSIFLNERMSMRSWLALFLALCGALLVLRPSLSYSLIGVTLGVASLFAYGARDVLTRRMPRDVDLRQVTLLSLILVTFSSLVLSTRQVWVMPTPREFLIICLVGLTFLTANFLIIVALYRTSLTRIAPLRFTAILWALLFDWGIWGYIPGPLGWVGIALILTGGLVMTLQAQHPERTL